MKTQFKQMMDGLNDGEPDSIKGACCIVSIPIIRSRRFGNDAETLVVTKRVSAYARETR